MYNGPALHSLIEQHKILLRCMLTPKVNLLLVMASVRLPQTAGRTFDLDIHNTKTHRTVMQMNALKTLNSVLQATKKFLFQFNFML